MSVDLEMSKQTIVAAEHESVTLEFCWGSSCCKGRYPRWKLKQDSVSAMLRNNGLTDERLEHELKLISDQVDYYYGSCIKCFVALYVILLLLGIAAIGAQFVWPEYRENIFDTVHGDIPDLTDLDVALELIMVIGGILAMLSFVVMMCAHRKCLSKQRYKKTMNEIKEYIHGFELQNKYQLVKWKVLHTVDSTIFDIIVTPLHREYQTNSSISSQEPGVKLSI